jgi:hypothetical protein
MGDRNGGFLRCDELMVDGEVFILDYLWENFQVGVEVQVRHSPAYELVKEINARHE